MKIFQRATASRTDAEAKNGKSSHSEENSANSTETLNADSWSSSVQILLDQPPSTLPQKMILSGTVFCLIFMIWAWFGQIEQVGKARGKLIPKGETYKIEPVDLGKVTNILVEEGEVIARGQVLVELDPELAAKEVERLEQILAASGQELIQKQGLLERVRLETQTLQAVASAETTAQLSAIALATGKANNIRQMLAQMQSEMKTYQTRQIQLEPLSPRMEQWIAQMELEVAAHQKRLEKLQSLQNSGAISQEYVFQAEQALRQSQQRLTQTQLQEVTHVKEQLFEAEHSLQDFQIRITQNQGELTSAIREAERLEAELNQKKALRLQTQLEAEEKIQQLQLEITQVKTKIGETENLLVSARTRYRQKFLKAPVDGIVLSLNQQNPGKVVQAGQTIAEIAPEGVPLVLSAVLPNSEAGFVKEGMPVQIKFDAYPYQDYGTISGNVTSISADAKPNESSGTAYRVEVALQQNYIIEDRQKIDFKPGQTATAEILIRRRRIMDLLLDPLRQIQRGGIDL